MNPDSLKSVWSCNEAGPDKNWITKEKVFQHQSKICSQKLGRETGPMLSCLLGLIFFSVDGFLGTAVIWHQLSHVRFARGSVPALLFNFKLIFFKSIYYYLSGSVSLHFFQSLCSVYVLTCLNSFYPCIWHSGWCTLHLMQQTSVFQTFKKT